MSVPEGIPTEADWDLAPNLMDGALNLELTPATCDLRYWLHAVPRGTLRGRPLGHAEETQTPDFMREPGPLRDALTQELAFRAIAEEKATRALGYLVALAPDIATMEFYTTQLVDEARHSMVFRSHLLELGIPQDRLFSSMDELASHYCEQILVPLEDLGLRVLRDEADFLGGVIVLTVLVEGVLAPAAELSERKWRKLDPAAAEIERGAAIDEIRHLTVGSAVAKDLLIQRPEARRRALDLVALGRKLWLDLPVHEMVFRRESLFQEGLRMHADAVGDYEIWPGRRLVDTTVEERLQAAMKWSEEMQQVRLAYMGLEEALD